ncbi:E3 ubiquitin-protein ligase Os03g0188200-like [Panicum virgatum]|uniref:RING-type E3 ubiquitin transferase n=1 Tax=Panicum virgatum TaxID=38727 RepID=A0A8T0XHW1_PANVG|nr:E3 ubiquitin-protein ligase Os03g0188200-like [Panicum virgatum]KAG2658937.1 hypothetical protein PVAP13_1KG323820 [Panicum virgatum]
MPSSAPRHHGAAGHALLAALLASALVAARAQDGGGDAPGGQEQNQQDQVSTAMVALLAAVVAVFVFIASATMYLRHCSGSAPPPADSRAAVGAFSASRSSRLWWRPRRRAPRGLDAGAVEAFPTMTYAEAKALRVGNGGDGGGALECAVCLSEFEDGERLRVLLPWCSHAFHPDCIGAWLAGHVTCPVCRCNLEPRNKDATTSRDGEEPTGSLPPIPVASSISSDTAAAWQRAGPLPVAVVIDVAAEEEEWRQEALELHRIGTQRRAMRSRSGSGPATMAPPQLPRRQSLAARLDRDLERFTLRLPEHVRREIVAAAAEHSLQLRRERGAAGGGGRSAPLVGLGRPGGWQSLLGTAFSGRLSFSAPRVPASCSGGGEVPSSSSSYSRLRGKRVAAVDADDDVAATGSSSSPDSAGVGGGGEKGGGDSGRGQGS